MMSIAQLGKLVAGAAVMFRNQISLVCYAATVVSIVAGQSLVINVPTLGGQQTFDLDVDGTIVLPIYGLQ